MTEAPILNQSCTVHTIALAFAAEFCPFLGTKNHFEGEHKIMLHSVHTVISYSYSETRDDKL